MIHIAEPVLGIGEIANLRECILSEWISYRGPFVKKFEESMRSRVGTKFAVATSSGTSALHLALLALGVKPGDEVIVPTLTFVATANAVKYCGATPVFADSHPKYWCVNPDDIRRRITKRTVGIIPVHLYGHPCDMDEILRIAERRGLWVVEDCAEAFGAEYRGYPVGSFSNVSCFSFFANKIVTTGEGGMCLTNSKELAEKIRIYGDHGTLPGKPYWHEVVGYNYRMTNLQAAVGMAQLDRAAEFLHKRDLIADTYKKLLPPRVCTPPKMSWADPVTWQYTVLFESPKTQNKVEAKLTEKEVETRPMFYPVTRMPPYKSRKKFPVAEDLSSRGLSLPSSPYLTEAQIGYICNAIKEAL